MSGYGGRMSADPSFGARLAKSLAQLVKLLARVRMGDDRLESDDREPPQDGL
jgi:hypothetical protein